MPRGFKNTRGKFKKFKKQQSFNKKREIKNKSYKRNHNNDDDNGHKNNYEESKKIRLKETNKTDNTSEESSEESENEIVFNKFVTTFAKQNNPLKPSIQSSSESESELDDNIQEHVNSDAESIQDIDESIEDEEHESDDEKRNDEIDSTKDPFVQHLHFDLNENLLNAVQNSTNSTQSEINWPTLGKIIFQIPKVDDDNKSSKLILEDKTYASCGFIPNVIKFGNNFKFSDVAVKAQISHHIKSANELILGEKSSMITDKKPLTDLQMELFTIINNYQDCYYPERNFQNAEEIRFIYSLHAVNHILKTRTKILHHNAKLTNRNEIPDEFRDQGLVRPKILIICPFQNAALRIVKNFINILVPDDKGQVLNKNRFLEEFTGEELAMPKKNPKPDDYQKLFAGNTNDNFRIGLSITKKSLKLYTEFYSSDIIIASPLGLRVIVGAPGEQERDYDFLASIEILILDQTDQFLMQNWDHFLHVMDHLHLQPKDSHGTDFSRVRMWSINGWAKYYRQTLIFASYPTPEINAFFNKRCLNYAGKAKIANPVLKGTICKVFVQIPQIFNRFNAKNVHEAVEARFDFFKNKILPQYKDVLMKHTLIYVPNYFDYVRLRNYFKQDDVNFVQICEYSKEEKIARARDKFFHAEAHFLLYSERFHHFRRIRLKGIRHIIFYQPPTVPHFYSELCNFMMECNQNQKSGALSDMSVTILYCKYDVIYLNSIIGTDRTARMFNSERNTHMFMTGE